MIWATYLPSLGISFLASKNYVQGPIQLNLSLNMSELSPGHFWVVGTAPSLIWMSPPGVGVLYPLPKPDSGSGRMEPVLSTTSTFHSPFIQMFKSCSWVYQKNNNHHQTPSRSRLRRQGNLSEQLLHSCHLLSDFHFPKTQYTFSLSSEVNFPLPFGIIHHVSNLISLFSLHLGSRTTEFDSYNEVT